MSVRVLFAAIPAIVLMSCGSDNPDDNPDAGGGSPTACGTSGALAGSECMDLAGCGAGAQNFVKVSFCEHCFARADTHVCEAGVCRELDQDIDTSVMYGFTIPLSLSAAQGFTVAAVNPIMADGSRATCETLLKPTCETHQNGKINARNSKADQIPAGAEVIQGFTSSDHGEDRMIFVQITELRRGEGALLGQGCATLDVMQHVSFQPIEVTINAL